MPAHLWSEICSLGSGGERGIKCRSFSLTPLHSRINSNKAVEIQATDAGILGGEYKVVYAGYLSPENGERVQIP